MILTAYPIEGAASLMGDMPVRICAEGGELVAYGFGGQRIAIPASEILDIRVRLIRNKDGKYPGSLTMVVGKTGQVLLQARAPWGPGLKDVCAELGLRALTFTNSSVKSVAGVATWQQPYPTLRVRPRGWLAAGFVTFIMAIASGGLVATGGVLLALLLPSSIGGIRDLIGIALGIAGVLGGLWLFFLAKAALLDSIRWLVTSARAGGPAPVRRIFEGLGESGRWLRVLVTVVLGAAIPLLFVWSLVIEADTIQHGRSDQALVSQLRQHGVTANGYVVNVPYYTTESNGDQVEHDQATLEFSPIGENEVQVPDPAIAGWTWPMNPATVVTVVYDPADPQTAAVRGQITGSPWHGAPTGNIVAGALVIVAEPFLIWLFVRRVTAARRKAAREFTDNLA